MIPDTYKVDDPRFCADCSHCYASLDRHYCLYNGPRDLKIAGIAKEPVFYRFLEVDPRGTCEEHKRIT